MSATDNFEIKQNKAGGYFQPRGLGHVNLVVNDVDKTMEFYYRIAGLNEAYRRPQVDAGFLTNGLRASEMFGSPGKVP